MSVHISIIAKLRNVMPIRSNAFTLHVFAVFLPESESASMEKSREGLLSPVAPSSLGVKYWNIHAGIVDLLACYTPTNILLVGRSKQAQGNLTVFLIFQVKIPTLEISIMV